VQFEATQWCATMRECQWEGGAHLAKKSLLAIQASAFKLAGICIGTRKLLARR
jgi:hypothetical protein